MGEIILATVLMELGEAVVEELERHLGGLLALKEMLVELLAIDDIDGAGPTSCTSINASLNSVESGMRL